MKLLSYGQLCPMGFDHLKCFFICQNFATIFVEREEIKGATSISTEGGECKEVEAGEGGTGGGFSSSTPVALAPTATVPR